jgi:hypothetical protein
MEPTRLERTDVSDDVIDGLSRSAVIDVYIVGRRGAQHAKFIPKELRELDNLDVSTESGLLPRIRRGTLPPPGNATSG